jgi:hypothetical protein
MAVFLSEISLHVLDEGSGDGWREIERLAYHSPVSSMNPNGL